MSEHTPGPWRLEIGEDRCFHDGNRCCITKSGEDAGEPWTVTVAEVWRTSNNADISDARLIASAPELLAALKKLVDDFDEAVDWIPEYTALADDARMAIAKAEGRGE